MCIMLIINENVEGVHKLAFYIIILGEILVTSLRFNLYIKNKSLDVSQLSKYKTFIQMIAIAGLIGFVAFDDYSHSYGYSHYKLSGLTIFVLSFIKFFIWLSAFITVLTGIQHFKTYLKLKK